MTSFPSMPHGVAVPAASAAWAVLACMFAASVAAEPAPSAPAALAAHVEKLAAGERPLGADLAGLLDAARAQSPELAAAQDDARAMQERVGAAGALPDPVLRVELENVTNAGNGRSPSLLPWQTGDTKITLMQALPLWGKRDLRRDQAHAEAEEASARAALAWNGLAARIKLAFAQYLEASGNARILDETAQLLQAMTRLADARYAAGPGAQQDAIQARIEEAALRAERIALDGARRQAAARINALLGRAADAPLAEPQPPRPLPAAAQLSAQALLERALSTNPELAAEQARLQAARSGQALAERNRYPDLQVGIAPTQTGWRLTNWSLMVEMSIPLQRDARRAEENEAVARVAAQRARAQALQARLHGELVENLAALDAAQRSQALLAAELLPQSELGWRSALAAYENGKVDFATLLEAQRRIRQGRVSHLQAQVQARLRLAEIERLVGEAL